MAMFLVLNIGDPNDNIDTAEAVQEIVKEATDKISDCLAQAAAKRDSCLADSPNLYGNALCESAFATNSLACLAN